MSKQPHYTQSRRCCQEMNCEFCAYLVTQSQHVVRNLQSTSDDCENDVGLYLLVFSLEVVKSLWELSLTVQLFSAYYSVTTLHHILWEQPACKQQSKQTNFAVHERAGIQCNINMLLTLITVENIDIVWLVVRA